MADEEQKYIYVRAIAGLNTPTENQHQVLLWEKDTAHPNNEAFIAGPIPVKVGETTAVTRLLNEKQIEKVTEEEFQAAQPQAPAAAALPVEVAQKEQELQARESTLAEREQLLQAREADVAKRLKEAQALEKKNV